MEQKNFLGDYAFSFYAFPELEAQIGAFTEKAFAALHEQEKYNAISETLLAFIQKAPERTFLLPAVTAYITRIRQDGILEEYSFNAFEFWLNQFSELSDEENYCIRGKIAGKYVPRDEYQRYFPIGMGKQYEGTHFVVAHGSPDLDTTIASFWGWLDAFAARVSSGMHMWNVPGGAPTAQVEVQLLFVDMFGRGVFESLAKTRSALTLSSTDLLTQEGMLRKRTYDGALSLDHERQNSAVVVLDEGGYYLGDWRGIDVEGVRQVIMSLNSCLRWLESHLHVELIALYSIRTLDRSIVPERITALLNMKLSECEPAYEFTLRQQKYLQDYLLKVLEVPEGLDATFAEFARAMERMNVAHFTRVFSSFERLSSDAFFDASGSFIEDRPKLFDALKRIVTALSTTFKEIRAYVEQLGVALDVKTKVFGYEPQYLSHRTDLEEIRSKMSKYTHLTVNYSNADGQLVPMGVVYASELQKPVLGTVTVRDFCNREEVKIPSYLEIISVIDHHKSELTTRSPAVVHISDAQSSNAVVANLAFTINDGYSTGGLSKEAIDAQIAQSSPSLTSAESYRTHMRLLAKKMACSFNDEGFFISPEREFLEYLHFLYGILDDTDLLTKVSRTDVECVAKLLNRMKSLMLGCEREVVTLDDIKDDPSFTAKASKRLLQNDDFYSLYSKVYASKESAVDEHIHKALKGEESSLFADVKVLSLCNRVSQSKIFANNYPTFDTHRDQLVKLWVANARAVHEASSQIDLFMHMVSTVSSADELYKGDEIRYEHKDELWFWVPKNELAIEHAKLFLNSFRTILKPHYKKLEIEFLGEDKAWEQIFAESFLTVPHQTRAFDEQVAILRYPAGLLNSRKAKIAPHLPTLSH